MPAMISLILIGVLQGITEFLPVSSSGHLSLFQYFSKDFSENLSLNVAVHVGTLLTIIIYYRKDLLEIFSGLLRRESRFVKMVLLILVASIPTAIIGLWMKTVAGWILTDPLVAASCLLITGLILFYTEKIKVNEKKEEGFGVSYRGAFLIGVVQGFAVLPGISRSGSTIVSGLYLGMTASNAAKFSFLISLPAIAGAGLLEFMNLESGVEVSSFLIGGAVSFVTGLLAISWMVKLTEGGRLKPFGYYVVFLSLTFFVIYTLNIGQGVL